MYPNPFFRMKSTAVCMFLLTFLASFSVLAANVIEVGAGPNYSVAVDGKLYINTAAGLAVVDSFTDTLVKTIALDVDHTNLLTAVGKKIYVLNDKKITGSGGTKISVASTVTVIDTLTDEIKTLNVGIRPINVNVIGEKVYILNANSNSVSIINSLNDTITPVDLGSSPVLSTVVGTKLYIYHNSNRNVNPPLDAHISIVDYQTNKVLAHLSGYRWLAYMPYPDVSIFASVGTKFYAARVFFDNIYILDTVKIDQIIASTPVDTIAEINTDTIVDPNVNPFDSQVSMPNVYTVASIGKEIFMTDASKTQTTVIDTESKMTKDPADPWERATFEKQATFSANMAYPGRFRMVGKKLYSIDMSTIQVTDALTHSSIKTITVGNYPQYMTAVGDKLYVSNTYDTTLSVIDTKTDTAIDVPEATTPPQLPTHLQLLNFSSSIPNGVYSTGAISINANFDENIAAGSFLTVTLNTGRTLTLNSVNSKSLSGSYVIQPTDSVADLAITAITSASVSNGTTTRTSYDLPSSHGNLVAENSKITRNLGDGKNIALGDPLETMNVGQNPYGIAAAKVNGIDYLYVANQGEGTVSVIRAADHLIIKTIPVGNEPYGLSAVTATSGTKYIVVANIKDNSVSVINTTTNLKTVDIGVGIKPYYVTSLGTKVYVTNSISNSVSVIDINSKTVTDTIPVGVYPRAIKSYLDRYLFVANFGDPNYGGGNTVSKIDTGDKNAVTTIYLPVGIAGPRGVAIVDNQVYVTCYLTNNVAVIDAQNGTVLDTVPSTPNVVDGIQVGQGPRGIASVGGKIYVENFDEGTLSVINTTTTPPEISTPRIPVGHSPSGLANVEGDLYISNFQDNNVLILDTLTNKLKGADISSLLAAFVAAYTKTVGTLITPTKSTSTTTTLSVTFPTILNHTYQVQGCRLSLCSNLNERIPGTGNPESFTASKSASVLSLKIYDLDSLQKPSVDALLSIYGINLADGNLTASEISSLRSVANQILYNGFDTNGKPIVQNPNTFFSKLLMAISLDKAFTPQMWGDFTSLFGLYTDPKTNYSYQQTLLSIVGEAGYKEGDFLSALHNAALLFTSLKNNTIDKTVFETFLSIKLPQFFNILVGMNPQEKKDSVAARLVLFEVAGAPGFNLGTFALGLPAATNLLSELRGNTTLAAHFKNLYGFTTPEANVTPVSDLRKTLLQIVLDYPDQNTFKTYLLPEASGHLDFLRANSILAAQFEMEHGVIIPLNKDYQDGNTKYTFDPIKKFLLKKTVVDAQNNELYSLSFMEDGKLDTLTVNKGPFTIPDLTIKNIIIGSEANVTIGSLNPTEMKFFSSDLTPSQELRNLLLELANVIMPLETPAPAPIDLRLVSIAPLSGTATPTKQPTPLNTIRTSPVKTMSPSPSARSVHTVQVQTFGKQDLKQELPTPVIQVSPLKITLEYNKQLNESSVPQVSDFELMVNGRRAELTSLSIKKSSVILVLKNKIAPSAQVKVNYKPGNKPLEVLKKI